MAKLRLGAPYWLGRDDERSKRKSRPALRHDLDVEVAIVGGGVTGCAIAHELARSGMLVALVEAGELGHGSTAASTALLMQEPDSDFGELSQRLGPAGARHVWRSGRNAVTNFRKTLQSIRVNAAGHALPSLYFTRDAAQVRALEREHAARRAHGVPGRWLSSAAIGRLAGFHAEGGILTQGNAQVDPLRACLGLADAAERHGALLFEHSPAGRMHGTGAGVEVHIGSRRLRAAWGIVATGYTTPELKPLAAHFNMVTTYVIATPVLTRSQRAEIGLGDVMLWDTERPYHYARWTPDGRLLFGGGDRPRPSPRQRASAFREATDSLRRELSGFYPSLAHVEPEYAWEGLFANTPDGLPYIGPHRRYPRHLFALGYGGNGMTFSYMAAGILRRIIAGTPRPEDALFGFGRGR